MKKNYMLIFLIFMLSFTNSKCDENIAIDNSKIIVYYFHASLRCETCQKIEALTIKVVKDKFSKELENGKMELKIVNIDKTENKHFIKEYNLYMQTVILSKVVDEKEIKYKSLDKVWDLVKSPKKFFSYIEDEIDKF